MTDTFTWRVNSTAAGGSDFNVLAADFGDGYSQRSAFGLNPEKQKWDVTLSGTKAYVKTVIDFLRAHIGVSFYWTPPLADAAGYYFCNGFKPSDQGGGIWTLNMTFEETFQP